MNKTVIIINGRGGCGKDTLCDITAEHYRVMNVSSITPVKNIARLAGWNGEKDPASRKMLADLKKIFTDYNDLCNSYLVNCLDEFLSAGNDSEIMFAHIREASEIAKFKSCVSPLCRVFSLLVKRETSGYSHEALGNTSDDDVESCDYDFVFVNNAPDIETLANDFTAFLGHVILKEQ